MSPLNIHPEEEVSVPKKKKNKTLKVMLGIAALVAVPVIGTTLAASITIGTNNAAINFGQGVVQATACDSAVTVTTTSTFANATGAGSFKLGNVTIAGIANTCNAKKFVINVYPDSSTSVGVCEITNFNGSDSASPTAVTTDTLCANDTTAGVKYQSTTDASNGTIVVKFGLATSAISASDVYKVTVESS